MKHILKRLEGYRVLGVTVPGQVRVYVWAVCPHLQAGAERRQGAVALALGLLGRGQAHQVQLPQRGGTCGDAYQFCKSFSIGKNPLKLTATARARPPRVQPGLPGAASPALSRLRSGRGDPNSQACMMHILTL